MGPTRSLRSSQRPEHPRAGKPLLGSVQQLVGGHPCHLQGTGRLGGGGATFPALSPG